MKLLEQAKINKLADYFYNKMKGYEYNVDQKFLLSKLSIDVFNKNEDISYDEVNRALEIIMDKYDFCLMITDFTWHIVSLRTVQVARQGRSGFNFKPKKEEIPEEWINGLAQMVTLRIMDVIKYTNAESTTLYWKDIEDDMNIKIPGIVKTRIEEGFNRVHVRNEVDDIAITVYANRSSLTNPNAVITG